MSNTLKKILFCLLLALIITVSAFSHPHLFLDCEIFLNFKDKELQGFWLEWSFDKVFTAMIINDYDINSDGTFSEAEIHDVHDNAFINLENYHYFTFVTMKEKRWSPKSVSNFTCYLKDTILVYRFFVSYSLEIKDKIENFRLTIFDETYFTAVAYGEKPLHTIHADRIKVSYTISENKDNPYYYDPYGGVNDVVDSSKPGPGLLAAYPEELIITLTPD